MSITSLTSTVNRLEKEIATLEKQKSAETDRKIKLHKAIDSLVSQASKITSPSSLKSKRNQIRSKETELARVEKKKSDLSKKISDKNTQLRKYQINLGKEQEKERKRTEKEQLEFQKKLTREIEDRKRLIQETTHNKPTVPKIDKEYDVFISHATEDKEDFVRPLAQELQSRGIKVWYDEFELVWGDGLRRSIDKGLANSRYGIVVFSEAFFKKEWTQYELDGLVNREMNGIKVILPIWHKVSKDDVQKYSPSLADKLALNSFMYSVEEIAEEIQKLINN